MPREYAIVRETSPADLCLFSELWTVCRWVLLRRDCNRLRSALSCRVVRLGLDLVRGAGLGWDLPGIVEGRRRGSAKQIAVHVELHFGHCNSICGCGADGHLLIAGDGGAISWTRYRNREIRGNLVTDVNRHCGREPDVAGGVVGLHQKCVTAVCHGRRIPRETVR